MAVEVANMLAVGLGVLLVAVGEVVVVAWLLVVAAVL